MTAPVALLDLMQRLQGGFDGAKIDFSPVDERLHLADEAARQLLVSGRVADLDERLQLPIMRHFAVILEGAAELNRQLAFVAARAQAADRCGMAGPSAVIRPKISVKSWASRIKNSRPEMEVASASRPSSKM